MRAGQQADSGGRQEDVEKELGAGRFDGAWRLPHREELMATAKAAAQRKPMATPISWPRPRRGKTSETMTQEIGAMPTL